MFENFTNAARIVFGLANQTAQRLNNGYIETEHILLGLIAEGDGGGVSVLRSRHIDLNRVRLEVENLLRIAPATARAKEIPPTGSAKRVIEYAMEEARNLHHDYVGSEHLLIGLIREQEGLAAEVLTNLGLRLDNAREIVRGFPGPEGLPKVQSSTKHKTEPS